MGFRISSKDVEPLKWSEWSKECAAPYEVRAHHLMCAVCARGGCSEPPPGCDTISSLLSAMWEYPFLPIRINADVEVGRSHYLDVYEKRDENLPDDFYERSQDHIWRRKDLEVIRVLGITPGTVLPAFWVYQILFLRQPTLEGICRTGSQSSKDWPECPYASSNYYESIACEGSCGGFTQQTELGEKLAGHGLWAMVRPRTRAETLEAKEKSVKRIMEADKLFMRPQHVLCLLCHQKDPTADDNLPEMRWRMEKDPNIPIILNEGCCMACEPCSVYYPPENVCYHVHFKNSLRDLMILERLGLAPGSELPASELYALVFDRISSLKEICGWRDGSNTALFWAPCGYEVPVIEEAKNSGFLNYKKK